MIRKTLLALLVLFISNTVFSQDLSLFEKHLFIHRGDTLRYRLLLPLNYNPGKMYPMVLFLHGSGERGNDNEAQLVHGADLFLRDSIRKKYPAIIVFPQCTANDSWVKISEKKDSSGKRLFVFKTEGKPTNSMRLVQELVKKIIYQYPVTKKQIYVGGLSMGGLGTFEIVRRNPKLFAAAFAICGGADSSIAPKLKKVNWWIFHGAKDDVVNPQYSEIMVTALKQQNAPVKFTLYPNASHNSWDNAFAEPGLMPWLFSNKKGK
jgi:predicted peptidase